MIGMKKGLVWVEPLLAGQGGPFGGTFVAWSDLRIPQLHGIGGGAGHTGGAGKGKDTLQ